MVTLEQERYHHGATFQDEQGHYFLWRSGVKIYGYGTTFGGSYVCFTCGHLCECGE